MLEEMLEIKKEKQMLRKMKKDREEKEKEALDREIRELEDMESARVERQQAKNRNEPKNVWNSGSPASQNPKIIGYPPQSHSNNHNSNNPNYNNNNNSKSNNNRSSAKSGNENHSSFAQGKEMLSNVYNALSTFVKGAEPPSPTQERHEPKHSPKQESKKVSKKHSKSKSHSVPEPNQISKKEIAALKEILTPTETIKDWVHYSLIERAKNLLLQFEEGKFKSLLDNVELVNLFQKTSSQRFSKFLDTILSHFLSTSLPTFITFFVKYDNLEILVDFVLRTSLANGEKSVFLEKFTSLGTRIKDQDESFHHYLYQTNKRMTGMLFRLERKCYSSFTLEGGRPQITASGYIHNLLWNSEIYSDSDVSCKMIEELEEVNGFNFEYWMQSPQCFDSYVPSMVLLSKYLFHLPQSLVVNAVNSFPGAFSSFHTMEVVRNENGKVPFVAIGEKRVEGMKLLHTILPSLNHHAVEYLVSTDTFYHIHQLLINTASGPFGVLYSSIFEHLILQRCECILRSGTLRFKRMLTNYPEVVRLSQRQPYFVHICVVLYNLISSPVCKLLDVIDIPRNGETWSDLFSSAVLQNLSDERIIQLKKRGIETESDPFFSSARRVEELCVQVPKFIPNNEEERLNQENWKFSQRIRFLEEEKRMLEITVREERENRETMRKQFVDQIIQLEEQKRNNPEQLQVVEVPEPSFSSMEIDSDTEERGAKKEEEEIKIVDREENGEFREKEQRGMCKDPVLPFKADQNVNNNTSENHLVPSEISTEERKNMDSMAEMGFKQEDVILALRRSQNNIGAAINFLIQSKQ
eukprot:TRINITY_DN776_c2_g1_i1.p1 TRINITY_DN776_c2_g1~~TRINITY_DN776_c2_g1_i1.p1  ORF type:complete len:872 (-),score=260.85 TRINITY_DN776_c2_g1_i1:61-2481(-)